jgi:hypothetical protein
MKLSSERIPPLSGVRDSKLGFWISGKRHLFLPGQWPGAPWDEKTRAWHPKGRHTLNPVGLGKEWRRALEGGSEAWTSGYREGKPKKPMIPTVRDWRQPRPRKNSQACCDDSVDCRRPCNHEHQQDSEQKKRDHPAHPCKQQRLIIRKAQYKQAEQILRGCLPVALRLRHVPYHANNCTPRSASSFARPRRMSLIAETRSTD